MGIQHCLPLPRVISIPKFEEEHVEDRDEDRKGHKLHTPESHWWDHLWPFMMMTAAFLGAIDQRLKQHHCNCWTLEKVHHIYSPLGIFWTFSFEKALPNPLNPLSHCFEVRARTRSCSVGHKPSPPTKVLNVFCCPVRFPAIGVYAFKRAQSAMQQPLLEEAQTVV